MKPRIEHHELVLPGQPSPCLGCSFLWVEHFCIRPIGQHESGLVRKARLYILQDASRLTSYQPSVAVTKGFQPHTEAMTQTSSPDHSHADRALRPQVAHIENQPRALQTAQPNRCDAEE